MQEDEHLCNTELCLGLNVVKFAPKNKQKRNDLNKDDDNYRRKKLKLTKEQTRSLEDTFKLHVTLNSDQKYVLAEELNLQPRQVEVWFQNKRARTKQKKTEAESEFLEKCCQSLSKQNQNLKKEVQRLQALQKFVPKAAALPKLCAACENATLQTPEVKPGKVFRVVGHAIKLENESNHIG